MHAMWAESNMHAKWARYSRTKCERLTSQWMIKLRPFGTQSGRSQSCKPSGHAKWAEPNMHAEWARYSRTKCERLRSQWMIKLRPFGTPSGRSQSCTPSGHAKWAESIMHAKWARYCTLLSHKSVKDLTHTMDDNAQGCERFNTHNE